MAYLVLARKWRPKQFDDIVGQQHVTQTLQKAIERQRIAHAYIFSGTRGVGKTTTARILARALNCEQGPTPAPCGTCDACTSILSGSSFDVMEIDGASNNRVEDIRELRENIHYSSMGGSHRIIVIDEVHMLSRSAFNALLKTLEEPPKNVIFIFATTEPHKIPETIHSRCQRYDFRRISTANITERLEYICTQENIAFEKGALSLLGRKAEGSMRDALSLLDQVLAYCQENITEKEVRSVLGIVDRELYGELMDAIRERNSRGVLETVETVLYRGFDLQEFCTGLQEHIRNQIFATIEGVFDNQRIDLSGDDREFYEKHGSGFSRQTLLRMAEIVRKTESQLRYSIHPRFVVELSLLKLLYLDDSVSVEQLLSAMQSLRGENDAAAAPPPPPNNTSAAVKKKDDSPPPVIEPPVNSPQPPVPHASAAPVDNSPAPPVSAAVSATAAAGPAVGSAPADVGAMSVWPRFVEALMADRPNLGSFLTFATCTRATENQIDIRFPAAFRFQFTEVTRHASREEITRRLGAFAGRPIELHITIETEKKSRDTHSSSPAGPAATALKQRPSFEDEASEEPIIQKVLDIFDGEIL